MRPLKVSTSGRMASISTAPPGARDTPAKLLPASPPDGSSPSTRTPTRSAPQPPVSPPFLRPAWSGEDFRNLRAVAEAQGILRADGILLDLGVSSQQLDDAARGFSYHSDAPLDMRMSQSGMSAYDLVNGYDEQSIIRILRDYGEERFAARIARAIVQARSSRPIETTLQLAELIKEAIPAATRREGGHPAKRSFQAIRIEVNGELTALESALDQAFDLLSVGGRLSIITFHSLEDRMVKRRFAVYTEGCTCPAEFPVCVCGKTPRGRLLAKKPVTASEEELVRNHRSRSAKLRCIEKIKD